MPPSAIFRVFKKTSCKRVAVTVQLNIPRAIFAKLKNKNDKAGAWFGTLYPGEGKRKLAAVAFVEAEKKNMHLATLYWFMSETFPPSDFGPFGQFVENMSDVFGEREVEARAEFSYEKEQTDSLFKPIDLGEQTQILDEIMGFTGIKRDPKGNTLYTLEVDISEYLITHKVKFRQTVKLDENMPIALVETASKISALAIKAKDAR